MTTAIRLIALGRKISNLYADLSAPLLREYGMNRTCFDVLMFCANQPEHNTARDLCEMRGLKSGIASVAVETLIAGGYLTRTPDAADRRKHRLVPTGKAADPIRAGREMQATFTDALRAGITQEELHALERLTDTLEENLTRMGRGETVSC